MHTASYQALDELTTEWRGLPDNLDSTYFINFFTPAPEHAWGQYTASELLTAEESNQKPLGWGPYVVEDFDPEEGITLRKNENYFRSSEGLPHFEKLVMRFVDADLNADLAMLFSGECDVLGGPQGIGVISIQELELLLELTNTGKINATFVSGTVFWNLDFGIQPASYDDGWQPGDRPDFFSDVRVRRAFALCLDRQRIMEFATLNQSLITDTYIPPQHPLYNPNVTQYPFDPVAGSALLEEAGWVMGQDGVRTYAGNSPRIPQGTRLSVENYIRSIFNQGAAQVMVDSLAQCGIEMEPSYWERDPLFAGGPEGEVFGRNFELAQFVWLTGSEPPCDLWLSENIPGEDLAIFPSGWGGQNNTGFSNAEYDQACRNALQTLPGQPGYVENHQLAQEIFADQLPVIMLYFNIISGATRSDFCGYILDPTLDADTWNIEEFDYGPDC
jgi:peptide/nickel transport system substrate-binding protein